MARRTLPQVIPWPAPYNGVIRGTALADQPPRSAINALNARNRDPKDWRLRMCRRAGLSKWIPDPVEGEDFEVQDIAFLNLNSNPPGVDLTIPGEPGTDDGGLFDPPLPFPPGDSIPDPEIPEIEPEEPVDSEEEPPAELSDELELSPSDSPTESSLTSSSEDELTSSSESILGPCEEACTDEVGVWLLIDPDTEVRPYCLPCIGSNDYGNVYAASHMVTYLDGELEITSLIYMELRPVPTFSGGQPGFRWRLSLFLTNQGLPIFDPEVILSADFFLPGPPPQCPDDLLESESLRQFLNVIRDEESPLAVSTQAWSESHNVRFDPQCYAGPRICDSVECDDHPTLSFTIDVVLLDPPDCVGGQTMQFSATLTQDPEKSCRWVYDVPDEPVVTLECFEDGDFSGFWMLSVTDTGGNAIIARRVIEDGPLGDYLFPPTAGGGISLAECRWSFIVLEVGA